MGEIQSSINSLIGSTALMGGLVANSPAGKRRTEYSNLKSKEKILQKKFAELDPNKQPKIHEELSQELMDVKKQKFNLRPNEKNYQGYASSIKEDEARQAIDTFAENTAAHQMTFEELQNDIMRQVAEIDAGNPNLQAADQADLHLRDVLSARQQQQMSLREQIDRLSVPDRRDILRYGAHVQSGAKRTAQHNAYEEGKNNGK